MRKVHQNGAVFDLSTFGPAATTISWTDMNSRILSTALQLIDNPNTWCKGARARNKVGQEVAVMSRSAVCFCSKGALLRAAGGEDVDISAIEKFFMATGSKGNKGNPLGLHYVGFNELRTHPELMVMWAEAIRLAQAEEARGGPPTPRQVIEEFFASVGNDSEAQA